MKILSCSGPKCKKLNWIRTDHPFSVQIMEPKEARTVIVSDEHEGSAFCSIKCETEYKISDTIDKT